MFVLYEVYWMIGNFFEIFVMSGNFVWLINDCFRFVKICGMLKNYKIMAYAIIYWYVNFWEIFWWFYCEKIIMFDYWKLLEWLENYKIVVYVIIYWYVNFWDIAEIFLVILLWKNNHVWLLEIIEMVRKL